MVCESEVVCEQRQPRVGPAQLAEHITGETLNRNGKSSCIFLVAGVLQSLCSPGLACFSTPKIDI